MLHIENKQKNTVGAWKKKQNIMNGHTLVANISFAVIINHIIRLYISQHPIIGSFFLLFFSISFFFYITR